MFQIDGFEFNRYLIKDHAAMRMLYRNIRKDDLEELLHFGEVIENYPDDYPFPSKLIFKMAKNRPLHSVVACSQEKPHAIIVTLYEPDLVHFAADFKTRRNK